MVVNKIFDQQYSSSSITQVKEDMKSKGSFFIDSPNLNLSTNCPRLIFKELESFVTDKQQRDALSDFGRKSQPSQFVRRKLLSAIEESQTIFIQYSNDIMDRVVRSLRKQMERTIVDAIRGKNREELPVPIQVQPFKIKKELFYSASILINDIKLFFNLYRSFQQTHKEYFSSIDSKESLTSSECFFTEELVDDLCIGTCTPLIPALHQAFIDIKLIDTYRHQQDEALIDRILGRRRVASETSSSSSESLSGLIEVQQQPQSNRKVQRKLSIIFE